MGKTTERSRKRSYETAAAAIMAVMIVGVYTFINSTFCQDLIRSWQYAEPDAIASLRSEVGLTNDGTRIFLASAPALESASEFNEHCNSHRQDVSMLGCYTGGKIYIYDIKTAKLADANKVTSAHELLHAVWVRMNQRERETITAILKDINAAQPEWAQSELELYQESERMEELYTRVGTKLREIPEDLENHYRKYFTDRLRIVDFYENYQAPFNKLIQANAELKVKLDELGIEIEQERAKYEDRLSTLETKIDDFNRCAEVAGCFASQNQFLIERSALEQERQAIALERSRLNEKIDYNNALAMKYQENQLELGDLSNAMNSNVERIEETAI